MFLLLLLCNSLCCFLLPHSLTHRHTHTQMHISKDSCFAFAFYLFLCEYIFLLFGLLLSRRFVLNFPIIFTPRAFYDLSAIFLCTLFKQYPTLHLQHELKKKHPVSISHFCCRNNLLSDFSRFLLLISLVSLIRFPFRVREK